jgi:hypothetical protein
MSRKQFLVVSLVNYDRRQIFNWNLPSLSRSSPKKGCPVAIKPSANFVNAESPLSIIVVRNFLFRSSGDDNAYVVN